MSLIDAIALSHQDQRLGTEGTCKVKKNENNYIDDAKPSFCEYYQDKAGALKS